MRETVRSIRAWFIISGGFSIWGGIKALMVANGVMLVYLYAALNILLGGAVLGAGIVMPRLLKNSPGVVTGILIGGGFVIAFTASLLFHFGARGVWAYINQIVGIAVTVYLYFNVKRLAKALQAAETDAS